jgi:RNA polymerase-binding protein DksA
MGKKGESKSKLTAADLEKFRNTLLAKRAEILGDVTTMEDESIRKPRSDLSNLPIHMADVGSDTYEVENTLGLMDSERKLIVEIDDALARIENGTYGICQGSGEPISKQRLEAIPWARYCVKYASLLEKGMAKGTQAPADSQADYGADDELKGQNGTAGE